MFMQKQNVPILGLVQNIILGHLRHFWDYNDLSDYDTKVFMKWGCKI